jgi:hypothetical protein
VTSLRQTWATGSDKVAHLLAAVVLAPLQHRAGCAELLWAIADMPAK